MMSVVAIVCILVFILLALIHIYWAFGGKYAVDKAVPTIDDKPAFVPGRLITLFVAACLFACAMLVYVLAFYDVRSLWLGNYIIYLGWLLAAIFVLRAIGDFKLLGFFKTIRTSTFAYYDTRYYSPLCLALGFMFSILSYINH